MNIGDVGAQGSKPEMKSQPTYTAQSRGKQSFQLGKYLRIILLTPYCSENRGSSEKARRLCCISAQEKEGDYHEREAKAPHEGYF